MLTPNHRTVCASYLARCPERKRLPQVDRAVSGDDRGPVARQSLDRTERSEHYPWIDTKINLITGEDLPPVHPLLGL